MKINCIAIDDEPLALEKIQAYISRVPYLNLLKTFDNAISALDFIKNEKVDLIFLDIQMDELNGIQMLEVLQDKPKVILTTAYDEYALKSYELEVCDYLLKPISFPRFLSACEKISSQLKSESPENITQHSSITTKANEEDYFFVKNGQKVQKVNFKDILFIEGMKDYVKIRTMDEDIMTLLSFKKLEEILPEKDFIRIHKSYMISLKEINSIERNTVLINNEILPVGKSYQKDFFNKISKKKLN